MSIKVSEFKVWVGQFEEVEEISVALAQPAKILSAAFDYRDLGPDDSRLIRIHYLEDTDNHITSPNTVLLRLIPTGHDLIANLTGHVIRHVDTLYDSESGTSYHLFAEHVAHPGS